MKPEGQNNGATETSIARQRFFIDNNLEKTIFDEGRHCNTESKPAHLFTAFFRPYRN
jgi:hypothetical protein